MEEFHLDHFNIPVRSLPFHRARSIARTMEEFHLDHFNLPFQSPVQMEEFHLDHFDSHSIATIRIHGED